MLLSHSFPTTIPRPQQARIHHHIHYAPLPSSLTRVQFTFFRRAASPSSPSPPQCSTHPAPPHDSPSEWQVLRIRGDGRCMFRSLAQGQCLQQKGGLLVGEEETAAADALRGAICKKLQEKCDDIAPFIEGDFDQYVSTMNKPHTWVWLWAPFFCVWE